MKYNSFKTIHQLKGMFLFLFFLCSFTLVNSQETTVVKDVVIEDRLFEETVVEEIVNNVQQDALPVNYPTRFIAPTYHKKEFYTVENFPNPKDGEANGYISDPDDFISEHEEYEINKILWEIEKNTTAQIAVAIVNNIGNEVPKDFAVKLFKKWGIGYAAKDNGLLILTIINQRRTEFEVGYGLEPILTDLVCHRIGTDEIIPYFKKAAYGNGITSAVKKVKKIIENPEVVKEIYAQNINYSKTSDNKALDGLKSLGLNLFLVYLLVTLAIVYADYQKIKIIDKSKEDFYDKYKDLQELKDAKAGCFSFLLFMIFPITAIFFYQFRKKRLKSYRYAPRFSRINGKKLKLMNEWAENKFLEEGNILEEKIKAKEYDVWVTDDESDILILEYKGSSRNYTSCSECGYKTYGKSTTITLAVATYSSGGKKKNVYLCKNCHFTDFSIVNTPMLVRHTSSSSSGGYSSSSSSSSSSFGGGSSGGGGAGVSW